MKSCGRYWSSDYRKMYSLKHLHCRKEKCKGGLVHQCSHDLVVMVQNMSIAGQGSPFSSPLPTGFLWWPGMSFYNTNRIASLPCSKTSHGPSCFRVKFKTDLGNVAFEDLTSPAIPFCHCAASSFWNCPWKSQFFCLSLFALALGFPDKM